MKLGKNEKWKARVHVVHGTTESMTLLHAEIDRKLKEDSRRPKKLKVFINPFGGKRRAVQNMARVRPLFQLAKVRGEAKILSSIHQI